jgi:2-polyprenyl-3-methyl-5-hydroxy-6-metoxy-1,4-benzoquinol methylase
MSLIKKLNYYSGDRIEMLQFLPDKFDVILDVGCGQGKFGELLMKKHAEVWGIEPFEEAASLASKVLSRVYTGRIEDKIDLLPKNYFDVIFFNDVLEHLIDPLSVISEIKDKLKPEGLIVASVPNFRYITNLSEILIFRDFKYQESGIMDSSHLRFFTKKSIIRMFHEGGYSLKTIKGIVQTKSVTGLVLATSINLISLGYHKDIFYKQFVIIASREK